MQRRSLLSLTTLPAIAPFALLAPAAVHAHHGWSGFDQERPIYLEGRVKSVAWQNPHAELKLELAASMTVPASLAQRTLPAQTAPVDGKALMARAVVPTRRDRVWEIELAPLSRMQAWNVEPLKVGDAVSLLGFTLTKEQGDAVLRAEYLFVGDKAYGLRSSPV